MKMIILKTQLVSTTYIASLIRTSERKCLGYSRKDGNDSQYYSREYDSRMRKLQTDMIKLKNFIGKMKYSREILTSRAKATEDKMSDLQNVLHNTSRQ